jgi:hypothetical protein
VAGNDTSEPPNYISPTRHVEYFTRSIRLFNNAELGVESGDAAEIKNLPNVGNNWTTYTLSV